MRSIGARKRELDAAHGGDNIRSARQSSRSTVHGGWPCVPAGGGAEQTDCDSQANELSRFDSGLDGSVSGKLPSGSYGIPVGHATAPHRGYPGRVHFAFAGRPVADTAYGVQFSRGPRPAPAQGSRIYWTHATNVSYAVAKAQFKPSAEFVGLVLSLVPEPTFGTFRGVAAV